MRRLKVGAQVAVCVLLMAAAPLRAQVLYGSIVGTVQDRSQAVIAGAKVTITNTGTSQVRETVTNSAGVYAFTNVFPGTYNLSVSAEGFRTYTEENIAVTVNVARRTDVTLDVGQVTEKVTVEATALTLQTEKTDVHVELTSHTVVNLPLPVYRNYQSLINLTPGATPGVFQNSVGSSPERALSVNVNGVNRNNNVTKIDGAPSIFIWLPHHAQYVPPADTIETVNISTNNFDAEQGMAGGASIILNTKSGTNDLHGTAFVFHDNHLVRAKNFFSPGNKPKSIRNIDGFTMGGPVVKNKFFYFGGWEGMRERLGVEQTSLTVATADQRAGNFSAYNTTIYDPATGNLNGSGRTAFANNTVPLSRQSAIARKIQDLVPAPLRPGTTSNYFTAGTQSLDRDNFDLKVNWNRTERNTIWGKYSAMRAFFECAPSLGPAYGPGLCGGESGTNSTLDQMATIGQTWTLSPYLIWDGTISWTRHGNASRAPDFGTNYGSDVLGIPGTNGADPRQSGFPLFAISGYTGLGNNNGWQPNYYGDTTYTLEQNFSLVKGSHNLRFGFQGLRHWMNHWQPEIGGGPRGRFNFDQGVTGLSGGPSLTQYNAYASFLLGLPSLIQKSLQYEKMSAFNYQLGWYIRDRWQITPKLTFNWGLRYELYPLMTRGGRGGIEWWDPDTNLVYLGGAGGTPKDIGITTSHKLFAPRVGIAYRVAPKTVIRTGYGITYNPMPLARPLRGFFPLTIAKDFPSPNSFQPVRPLEQGIPEIIGPATNVGSVPLPVDALNRSISGKELKRGYVQSWNFTVERELPGSFIGSVAYVGTQTVRSFADLNINASEPGGGTAGRALYSKFGRTADTNAWNGFLSANYHSLQMAINRHAAAGLTIKGAYTYSKAINMTDDDGWAGLSFNAPSQLARNRALAGYDRTHIFQMGWVYELPFGAGKSHANQGVAKTVLGNWQVNGVSALFSGQPFTVTASGASLNAPGNTQTADQVKPEVQKLGGVGPGAPFYDPTAFAAVTQVRFGNTGRNILRGPGTVNFDLGVFRKFPIGEVFILQFRAEAFNAMNTPHFNNPNANVSSGGFLQVLSANQDQRQFRFGLHLSW